MIETKKIWRPNNVKDAWEIQTNLKPSEYCYVSGGTWLRTQWEADLKEMPSNLISLEQIHEMKEVKEILFLGKREIVIGSQVNLAACIKNPLLIKCLSPLVKACRNIAAPSIRNVATIGGNIYTAAGDTIPAFLIHNAKMRWFNGKEMETELMEEWLIGLQANEMKRDQRILVDISVEIDERSNEDFSFFQKVGRRETFTASLVTVAGKGKISSEGTFQEVSLAAGGGPIPFRLPHTESELQNTEGSEDLFKTIFPVITKEFNATSDPFASSDYKKTTVANLIISELFEQWDGNGGVSIVAGS
ncbi:FAD binding domain-containing protein [Halalkalibacter alkaliphilus]|uniref:FAD binding domain-containing protein n=1 Tax=Halalkalibacter alkaliphilus TaxID=2917993 RepID=A0A9X2CT16_9BACI|nr:FAD binding domain-containing protein [Halalkalibacter alkaliphilus]MCL7747708.1 FAD binding domain-containing protein [Halalkalibacter alkaliphilus]